MKKVLVPSLHGLDRAGSTYWMCRRGFGRVYYIFGSEEFWAELIMDLVEKNETVEQLYAKLKQNSACCPTFWVSLHI